MSIVRIINSSDSYANTRNILNSFKYEIERELFSPVLIKPNLVVDTNQLGVVTKVEIVKAVLDFLIEDINYKGVIIIGEGSAGNTETAYEKSEYYKMLSKYSVKFVDFNNDQFTTIQIIDPLSSSPLEIKISQTALKSRYIISCAPMKTHDFGIVTLSLKNMLGIILKEDKHKIHGVYDLRFVTEPKRKELVVNFHKNIYNIVLKVLPSFAILDSNPGIECDGPVNGTQIWTNLTLGSNDAVACDAMATYLMGFDPYEIGYLYYLSQNNIGTADISKMLVQPKNFSTLRKKFRPHRNYYYMTFYHEI